MPGQGPQDFIFQHPLKPEGGPEGDIPIMSFLSVNCICPKYPKTDLHNFGPLGCRTPVSSTFLTPKLALKVVLENANNVYSEG